MQISWLGLSAFRFQNDGTTVIADPSDTAMNFTIQRQSADIVIMSKPNEPPDGVGGKPFLVTGPGEYEVRSVFIHGIPVNGMTVYLITIDDIGIAFLGGAKIQEFTEQQLEVLEGADVLIVPIGGGAVGSAKDAVTLINQIEPRIVIPSCYRIPGSKGLDSVDAFLKEYQAVKEEVEKLKLHKKDLLQEDTKVVILKHQ